MRGNGIDNFIVQGEKSLPANRKETRRVEIQIIKPVADFTAQQIVPGGSPAGDDLLSLP